MDKKGFTNTNAFQKDLNDSGCKADKMCVDKYIAFYNSSTKSQLQDNDIEMYSTYNEGKSVVAERFVRTLNNKICKSMTSISKNVYIDKLDDIVNEYSNTHHSSLKLTETAFILSISILSTSSFKLDLILQLNLMYPHLLLLYICFCCIIR